MQMLPHATQSQNLPITEVEKMPFYNKMQQQILQVTVGLRVVRSQFLAFTPLFLLFVFLDFNTSRAFCDKDTKYI